jgi:hypothetical protein
MGETLLPESLPIAASIAEKISMPPLRLERVKGIEPSS